MSSLFGSNGMGGATGAAGLRGTPGPLVGQKLGGGYKQGQLQQFSPEQMQLFQSLFSHVSPDSFTGRLAGGQEDIFNQIEQPALKQFNALQGGLASRFTGAGGQSQGALSGRRSSGFQNTTNAAAQDFASQLQQNRQGLQRQAIQDLLSMGRDLLHEQPYENFKIEPRQKQPSFLQQLLGGVSSGIGTGIGGYLGQAGGGNPLGQLFGWIFGNGGKNQ